MLIYCTCIRFVYIFYKYTCVMEIVNENLHKLNSKGNDKTTKPDQVIRKRQFELPFGLCFDNSESNNNENVCNDVINLKCNKFDQSVINYESVGDICPSLKDASGLSNESKVKYLDENLDLSMNVLQDTKPIEQNLKQQNLKDKKEMKKEELQMKINTLVEEIIQLKLLNKQKKISCSCCCSCGEMHSQRERTRSSRVAEALITENILLRKQIKDLKVVNTKWQKYFMKFQKSHEKPSPHSQDASIKQISESGGEVQCSNTLKNINTSYEENAFTITQVYDKIASENHQLQEENKHLNETIDLMKNKLSSKSNEYTLILEMQLKIYKEDFENEHKEKLAEQIKVQEMKHQLEDYHKRIVEGRDLFKEAKRVLFSVFENPTTKSAPECKTPSKSSEISISPLLGLNGNFKNEASCMEGVQKTLCEREKIRNMHAELPEENNSNSLAFPESWIPLNKEELVHEAKNTVRCPACSKAFPPSCHYLFPEHFSICQNQ